MNSIIHDTPLDFNTLTLELFVRDKYLDPDRLYPYSHLALVVITGSDFDSFFCESAPPLWRRVCCRIVPCTFYTCHWTLLVSTTGRSTRKAVIAWSHRERSVRTL